MSLENPTSSWRSPRTGVGRFHGRSAWSLSDRVPDRCTDYHCSGSADRPPVACLPATLKPVPARVSRRISWSWAQRDVLAFRGGTSHARTTELGAVALDPGSGRGTARCSVPLTERKSHGTRVTFPTDRVLDLGCAESRRFGPVRRSCSQRRGDRRKTLVGHLVWCVRYLLACRLLVRPPPPHELSLLQRCRRTSVKFPPSRSDASDAGGAGFFDPDASQRSNRVAAALTGSAGGPPLGCGASTDHTEGWLRNRRLC